MNKIFDNTSEELLKHNNIDPKLARYYYKYLQSANLYSDELFYDGINRLIAGQPIQYIIGNVDFYGYPIKVNKNVLIPRFETEELVYYTLQIIDRHHNKILDLATGSGAIAIALKKQLPQSIITASDISEEALLVARENALHNNCSINFICSDIFSNINDHYNVIISNPPYIGKDEIIEDIVKNNEPHIALYASNNGIYFYEKILKNASNYLENDFLIALEIGYQQRDAIVKIAKNYFPNSNIITKQDMAQKDRFIFIKSE